MKLAILIVTYNSEKTISAVLNRLSEESAENTVFILDNSSTDSTVEVLERYPDVSFYRSQENLGYCKGNNTLLQISYRQMFSHFLFLNPDAAPEIGALEKLIQVAEKNKANASAFTPKIIRANAEMTPVTPNIIDAAGMYFTKTFRHLDRGSNELDNGQFQNSQFVSGGTGAALLVTKEFVEKISYHNSVENIELFDERFFAYREDAELALRANRYGEKYLYVPSSVFYHIRKVLPENRAEMPEFLNALSVRNRAFLLLNHYSFKLPLSVQLATFYRNILVFGYAFAFEPVSRKLIFEVFSRLGEHLARRKAIFRRSTPTNYSKLFE